MDEYVNLYKETVEELKEHGKTIDDIRWIGTKEARFPLVDIANIFNYDYDDGFGGNEVPLDLLVVGDDWWLERNEYDGSEWWEFKTLPQLPKLVVSTQKAREIIVSER